LPVTAPGHYNNTVNTGWRLTLANLLFYRLLCGGKSRFVRGWLDFMSPPGSGCWLDVCCGGGEITREIAAGAPGTELIGVDLGRESLVLGPGRAPDNLTLIAADAAALPFRDARFDRVSISLGLHHMPRETRYLALREAHRVLQPEGVLYLQEYNLPRRGAARLLALFYARIDFSREAWPMVVGDTLRRELNQVGFELRRRVVTGRGVLQLIEAVKQAG